MSPVEHVGLLLQQFGEFEAACVMTSHRILLTVAYPVMIGEIHDVDVKTGAAAEHDFYF
jgi:hypothetical protein